MPRAISDNSRVAAVANQISSNLEGEEVILHLDTGTYYGLDEVGARVWTMLQQPCTVKEVCDAIMAEYDVDAARCRQDVLNLLNQLADAQLVEVVDAQTENTAATRAH